MLFLCLFQFGRFNLQRRISNAHVCLVLILLVFVAGLGQFYKQKIQQVKTDTNLRHDLHVKIANTLLIVFFVSVFYFYS